MMTVVMADAAAVDAVEAGASEGEFVAPHTKLLSWSVPLEVNVTKPTFVPAT